jgi:hypothetical protein
VREEIEHLDLGAYRSAADSMLATLTDEIGGLYRTFCPHYGDKDVPIKYALWVKAIDCTKCDRSVDLFPGYLIADDTRHPLNVLACHECGELNEIADLKQPGKCRSCRSKLIVEGPAKRNRCACRHCGHVNRYPDGRAPMRHRLFAIEYYNPRRKGRHAGRFFKKPDTKDLARVAEAERRWQKTKPRFVPNMKLRGCCTGSTKPTRVMVCGAFSRSPISACPTLWCSMSGFLVDLLPGTETRCPS